MKVTVIPRPKARFSSLENGDTFTLGTYPGLVLMKIEPQKGITSNAVCLVSDDADIWKQGTLDTGNINFEVTLVETELVVK